MRFFFFILAACAAVAFADGAGEQPTESSYAGQQSRSIKALSEDEISGLRNGHGMGMAKAVELNHYPGPRHVLDLAEQLKLSEFQVRAAESLYTEMKELAVALGEQIIAEEGALDSLCASGGISEDELETRLLRIGELRGQLRFSHMRAHLRMRQRLSEEQVRMYDELRGYR